MNDSLPIAALLAECDREPIQFPGAVQPHGAMLVVDPASGLIRQASANLNLFLDQSAAVALGQPLASLVGEETAALLGRAAQARKSNPSAIGIDADVAGVRVRLLPFISTGGGHLH